MRTQRLRSRSRLKEGTSKVGRLGELLGLNEAGATREGGRLGAAAAEPLRRAAEDDGDGDEGEVGGAEGEGEKRCAGLTAGRAVTANVGPLISCLDRAKRRMT